MPSSPTMLAAGTFTSSKYSVLVGEPFTPILRSAGPISKPGMPRSRMNAVTPLSVFAVMTKVSATTPLVLKALEPVKCQKPSRSTAGVAGAPASGLLPGSVSPNGTHLAAGCEVGEILAPLLVGAKLADDGGGKPDVRVVGTADRPGRPGYFLQDETDGHQVESAAAVFHRAGNTHVAEFAELAKDVNRNASSSSILLANGTIVPTQKRRMLSGWRVGHQSGSICSWSILSGSPKHGRATVSVRRD